MSICSNDIPETKFHTSALVEGIEIIGLRDLYKRKSKLEQDPMAPHRTNFNLLIYIEKGSGKHFVDFNYYSFKSGSFIFINKNQIHAFELTNNSQGKAMLFTKDFVLQVQNNMRIPIFSPTYLDVSYSPVFNPDQKLKKSCDLLLSEIKKETNNKDYDVLIVMFLFSSLLLMLTRARPGNHKNIINRAQNEKFRCFIDILEQGLFETREASKYADQLNITYNTLNRLCKSATGQTAKQLIDAYIILEAKRRLILKDKSIQQLSYDFGFDDPSNFVKYFRKHASLSPSHFRMLSKS